VGDEIIGGEVGLALSGRLAYCREGNHQRQERAVEGDHSKSPHRNQSLFLVGREKPVRLSSLLCNVGQCDLLFDGCCDAGVRSVASEKERCDGRRRLRSGPECRVCKGRQRCVESGENHEQANDDHDEVMRAHADFRMKLLRVDQPTGISSRCDLNPLSSSPASLGRHCSVNIVR
jgi:hypothetical protein